MPALKIFFFFYHFVIIILENFSVKSVHVFFFQHLYNIYMAVFADLKFFFFFNKLINAYFLLLSQQEGGEREEKARRRVQRSDAVQAPAASLPFPAPMNRLATREHTRGIHRERNQRGRHVEAMRTPWRERVHPRHRTKDMGLNPDQ